MAINKTAQNILIKITKDYFSTSGNLTKTAEYINIESTKNNLTLASNKKIQAKGMEMNETSPKGKKMVKLLIKKIEGPFDRSGNIVKNPVTNHKYIFKAYTDTISWENMIAFPPLNVMWAKMEGSTITNIPQYYLESRTWDRKNNCYIYTREIIYQHMRLYAYLDSPSEDVSLLLEPGANGFKYKGTKKWGTLQTSDKSISNVLKQGRQAYVEQDKAGTLGADTIDKLKKETEEKIRSLYEGGDFTQINLGTRDVLKEDTANLVISNFYTGGGKKLSFDENTRISKDLATNSTFKEYFKNYLKVIKEILEKYDIKTINGKALEEIFRSKNIQSNTTPNFSKVSEMYIRNIRDGQHEYYGLMGATQTIKIDLDIEEQDNNIYVVKTRMYIGDWYGSDWGDIYQGRSYDEIFNEIREKQSRFGKYILLEGTSNAAHALFQSQKIDYKKGYMPSLNAFFMLQYYFSSEKKYQPFESEIIYKSEDYLIINK